MRQAARLLATVAIAASAAVALLAGSAPAGRAATAVVRPQFTEPNIENAGEAAPQQFQIADFNNDGKNDIAEAIMARDGANILLGDGKGGFSDPLLTSLGPGGSPYWIAAADFNRDGKIDLAALVFTNSGSELRVLLGKGDGTFDVGPDLGSTADRLRAGDLNEDGKPDLAVLDGHNDRIQIYLGKGDGSFRKPTAYFFAGDDLQLGDVNGDGHLDIAWSFGRPLVRLGNGDGTFGDFIDNPDPNHRLAGINFTLADFDEDGTLDIAMDTGSPGKVQVGLGTGDGHFTPFAQYEDVAYQTWGIAAADFTGDGHLDIVTSGDPYFATNDLFTLLPGRGNGRFGTSTKWVGGGSGFEVGLLDGDDLPDVVTDDGIAHRVFPTLNAGGGFFRTPQAYFAGGPGTIVLDGDVTGDGRPDVIIPYNGTIGVQANAGGKGFKAPIASPGADTILSLALADFDGDGRLDAAAGSFPNTNVYVFRGQGNGHFDAPQGYGNGSGAAVLGVAAGDVDGDGKPDVVSNTFDKLSVLRGKGDGTFEAPIQSGAAGGFQVETLLGQFTGDASLDAVSVVQTGTDDDAETLLLLNRGKGDGTFQLAGSLAVDTNATTAHAADLNDDGRLDVTLVGDRGNHTGRTGLFVVRMRSAGFGTPAYYGVGETGLALADFNGDGSIDVITSCPFGACQGGIQLATYVNRGGGVLAGPFPVTPVGAPYALAAAKFTRDGKPDFVQLLLGGSLSAFAFYVNVTPP